MAALKDACQGIDVVVHLAAAYSSGRIHFSSGIEFRDQRHRHDERSPRVS